MPRPKRTRAAAASRKTAEEVPAPNTIAHPVHVSAAPSSDVYDLSDREKEKKRLGKQPARDDVGEMDNEQLAGSRHTRASGQSAKKRDATLIRLDDTTTALGAADTSSSDDVASPPEIGRRSEASTRRARHTDVSGLDLDDSVFGDLDLEDSIAVGDETRTGQHSTDTSSFNVAAFRRRPRVSSIVGRDDAPIRPSSRGPNTPGISSTINFGNFKRRKREPSILGTARKHRSRSRQPMASEYGSGDEQEGTHLGGAFSRQNSVGLSHGLSGESSPVRQTRKRKSLEDNGGSARKRTAIEPDEEIHDSIEINNPADNDDDDDDDDESALSSLPTTPPRAATPDPNDPDLAPPASIASSDDSPLLRAQWESLTHRNYGPGGKLVSRAQKTPELDADASDISSPPSLTHSPNYSAPPPQAASRGRARKRELEPAPKVTTEELESLLPRRRHKRANNDPFNISSDGEDEAMTFDNDDDELSYAHPKARRTKKPAGSLSKGKAKDKQPATSKTRGSKRTYGSKNSDKENGEEDSIVVGGAQTDDEAEDEVIPDDDESSQTMLERLGEELKNASKKFKEVDKWELEFEEITEPPSEAV